MSQNDLKDLQSLLQKSWNDSVVVKSYIIKDFLPPGENYGSKIVSVDAVIKKNKEENNFENLHMIAKLPPPTQYQREMFDSPYTFKKEIFMYEKILPLYRKLEIDNGVSERDAFNATAIFYGSRLSLNPEIDFDDDAAILLENLKIRGYYMSDRRLGCDLNHAKLVVKTLARFHSLGMAVKHKNPQFFEILKMKSKCLEFKNPEEWIEAMEGILKQIHEDPEINKYYDICVKAISVGDASTWTAVPLEPWSTIIHADFWLNNFMFHKNKDNLPDDIKFVDFQNYLFLSPIRELTFFLGCSVNRDAMLNHYDELVNLYYDTLIERLRILNCDVELYSRETFDDRVHKDARIELSHIVCMLKIITMDVKADNPDAHNVKNLMTKTQGNETFQTRLRDLVLFFQGRGWLD